MKIFIVLFAVCVSSLLAQPLTKEEKMQKLTAVAKVCQTQEGATDADVQEVINRVQPTTDTSKCLRACMFETFGSLQNGEINVDNVVEFLSKQTEDPAALAAAKEVSNECKAASAGLPRCALIAKFMECSIQGMTARGFDPKKL